MVKIANHMTRIVVIGKLESYEFNTTPFAIGKGVLVVGDQKVRFTIFNNDREGAANPHTKASDFERDFKPGDLIFITGNDNRSYSEAKDQYYEDVQVWDYREADEDETHRYVFVYIGDVKEIISKDEAVLSFINYKDVEMPFPLNLEKVKEIPEDFEVGARIKVKGELFNGLKMDFYGDGEYVTERNVVSVEVLNTAEEIKEAEEEGPKQDESGLW